MTLDPATCYRAVKSRDPRFDGRFFTGVLTTGIYCRPVCPARTPRPENVRFFACAAAAEASGLRPCMRCRPETAPGTPAWAGSAATVTRALRLIDEGFLDGAGVDELASVLGIGARHLRRLFDEHVGASPQRIAVTRRVHFARRLLDDTGLPVTEVAFSAGFSSVRRFNDAFRRAFGAPPSRVRRVRPGDSGSGATLRLRLRRRPPYDVGAVFDYLSARAIDGVEAVNDGYRRAVTLSGVSGVIGVYRDGDSGVVLVVPAALSRVLQEVVWRVRRVFDLDADPLRVSSHLARDPALAPLLRRSPGLPLAGAWDGFEMAVRAIVGQQVSVAAARTLLGRIARAYGERIGDGGGDVSVVFPTPERLARARLERFGVIAARARTIRALATEVASGRLDLGRPIEVEDALAALASIRGVGPWTVQTVAMRAFSDPDAFPAGDLGVRRAAARLLGVASARDVVARAESWRPWRAYAAVHLWRALSDETEDYE